MTSMAWMVLAGIVAVFLLLAGVISQAFRAGQVSLQRLIAFIISILVTLFILWNIFRMYFIPLNEH